MAKTTDKNNEFANQISKLSLLFFKNIFIFFMVICKFIYSMYQDYIFNRNYKRYLKYIYIYENCDEEEENLNV
jgi:hypothetical protein